MLMAIMYANIYKAFGCYTILTVFTGDDCMKKQEMVKIIKDPEQEKLFENPNFTRILSILRKGELTIKEIHRLFNEGYEDKKTLTTIYRYMEKLSANDLVFVSREELKRKHLIESYYSRTAKFFLFENEQQEKDAVDAASELLQQIFNLDEERREKLKRLIQQYNREGHQNDVEFYETYGDEILKTERTYGYRTLKTAVHATHEFLYSRKNQELFERIYEILEAGAEKS
jgi:DNA-binding PadR family transcriptional regulator